MECIQNLGILNIVKKCYTKDSKCINIHIFHYYFYYLFNTDL